MSGGRARESFADSKRNDRGSERKMGDHGKTATGVWTGNVHDNGLFADELLLRTAECRLRGCGASFQRLVRGHILAFHLFRRWAGGPATVGCFWLSVASSAGPPAHAARSHGQRHVTACSPSAAGALRACRLPIQQRAMTGTGLQAINPQVSGEDGSAVACNAPSVIRVFVRQPRGVRSSVRDVAPRYSASRQTGSR
jgi:hypothetical protein